MQLKSKFVFGLVVTMLVLITAPTSFAQVSILATGNPSAVEVESNRNALTNDRTSQGAGLVISGTFLAQSNLTETNVIITYPGPITSNSAAAANTVPAGNAANVPAADPIRIEGASGLFATVTRGTIDFEDGEVVVVLPTAANNTASGSFRLVGVRLDAAGLTAPVNASIALSNSANNYLLQNNSVAVITDLQDGIESLEIGARSPNPNLGTATVFTNAIIGDSTASLLLTEGFANAWKTATQESNSGVALSGSGTSVELTFSGIPSGVTLSLSIASQSNTLTGVAISDTSLTSASGDNDTTISFTGTSLTAVESIQINVSVTVPTATSVPAGSVTVVADLDPQGDALDSDDVPIATPYPRFSANPTAALTVVNIIAAETNLLVPFAVADVGFDTGIAVANTTSDPWAGSGGATAGSGTITVHFFPRMATGAGTAFSLTTGASVQPGIGLSADGTLAAGGTWSVLLSELLSAASQGSQFTGYLFIEANFILAHGTSFVTDFNNFTSASPVLVVPQTETTARTGFESLGL